MQELGWMRRENEQDFMVSRRFQRFITIERHCLFLKQRDFKVPDESCITVSLTCKSWSLNGDTSGVSDRQPKEDKSIPSPFSYHSVLHRPNLTQIQLTQGNGKHRLQRLAPVIQSRQQKGMGLPWVQTGQAWYRIILSKLIDTNNREVW